MKYSIKINFYLRRIITFGVFLGVLILIGNIYFRPPLADQTSIEHLPPLKIGDWVLRMGQVRDSQIIRYLSDGGRYSHIGIIVDLLPEINVLHATSGDDESLPDQVQITPLKQFISPKMAKYYAVVRPLFLNSQQQQTIRNILIRQKGQSFVLNPRQKEHLYCTTLLQEAIAKTQANFQPHWQTVKTPLFQGDYLFPDAFARYPQTQVIYQ